MHEYVKVIQSLPCWKKDVDISPLIGGITNKNFLVSDGDRRYVVRLGEDITIHHVMRFNEHAASQAAAEAGISPAVVFTSPGILVIDYIDAAPLTSEQIRDRLPKIVPFIRRTHIEVQKYLRGPVLAFWVFHVIRDYASVLLKADVNVDLKKIMQQAKVLEASVGAVELVYSHNDLLPSNFLHDGERLWLLDWEYAGFNSALFDLGGLASNNELDHSQEVWMLENYFERPLDGDLLKKFHAMKTASLIRETLWSMVSEIHSTIDFDYASYTRMNLERFKNAWSEFEQV